MRMKSRTEPRRLSSRTESQQSSDRSAFVDFVLLCVVYAKLELLLGKV